MRPMQRAVDIAISIGDRWPEILEQMGIRPEYLLNRHGPCPNQGCGGTDRYRFDNKGGRGGWICNVCGAGDGFSLLQRVHGWDFPTVRRRVLEATGLATKRLPVRSAAPSAIAQPTARVLRLTREAVPLADCVDVQAYLRNRCLWPMARSTILTAVAHAGFYDRGEFIAHYPALFAPVTDIDGELVTAHLTYVDHGQKLEANPRKILSPMTGRVGCAVRLTPSGRSLGIAEGIETAIAAGAIHGVPTWAALNAAMLAKFTPPAGVERLLIFADNDAAGLAAATTLAHRMDGRLAIEVRVPPAGDWADVWALQA